MIQCVINWVVLYAILCERQIDMVTHIGRLYDT